MIETTPQTVLYAQIISCGITFCVLKHKMWSVSGDYTMVKLSTTTEIEQCVKKLVMYLLKSMITYPPNVYKLGVK